MESRIWVRMEKEGERMVVEVQVGGGPSRRLGDWVLDDAECTNEILHGVAPAQRTETHMLYHDT